MNEEIVLLEDEFKSNLLKMKNKNITNDKFVELSESNVKIFKKLSCLKEKV